MGNEEDWIKTNAVLPNDSSDSERESESDSDSESESELESSEEIVMNKNDY